jgi:hypothetical protein
MEAPRRRCTCRLLPAAAAAAAGAAADTAGARLDAWKGTMVRALAREVPTAAIEWRDGRDKLRAAWPVELEPWPLIAQARRVGKIFN